jgi:hypothetical protein
MNFLARILSLILQPIFIPFYGTLLFTAYDPVLSILPLSAKSTIWLVVFLATALIPSLIMAISMKYGEVSDLSISNKKERFIPFLFTLISYFFGIYFLYRIGLDVFYLAPIIGAAFAIVVLLIVNSFWKISAHLSSIGGLCGAIFTYAIIYGTAPMILLNFMVLLSGILGWARMELKVHTLGQVCMGWLNGFLCVSIIWLLFFLS